ncbi:MAG: DUF1365 domain-containing protein [Bacteriovoracaceae bacterium]
MGHAIVPFTVTHKRLIPRPYKFTHNFFWFKIDLDNLNSWPSKFVSFNKPNIYSFYDKDHVQLGKSSAKDNYIEFARQNGLKDEVKKVTLYTSFRFFGYVFNPVSFILIEDVNNINYAIIEIGNTFNELKPYFVSAQHFNKDGFSYKTKKHFYISPFIPLDNDMHFVLKKNEQEISIFIDDTEDNQEVLKVWFEGKEIEATTKNLVLQTLRIPFVTLKIIFLIHCHAFVLWMKGITYFKKKDNADLQKGTYLWKR